jgi:hypothetical protein
MKPSLKVAVVGAGPAGCTLAILLRQNNINVTIFEGETSLDARGQGGSLDLHPKSGLAAVKECGLWAEFEKYARYDGEAMTLADKWNRTYIAFGAATSSKDSHGRPEIDRARLREILAKPLDDAGIIHWGCHLKSVGADGTLHFASGETVNGFDLIVGADGAWSKVRKVLTDVVPSFMGVAGLQARIPNAAAEKPWIDRLTKRGMWMSIGDGKSVNCIQHGDGGIGVSFWRATTEDWAKSCKVDDPIAIKSALHHDYRDWGAEYHAVIDAVDSASFQARSLYELPVGLDWESRPGFSDRGGLAPYIADFEKEMRVRVAPDQKMATANKHDFYFRANSPHSAIEDLVIRNAVSELGRFARIPATLLVYTYYYFAKWRLG